jgi:hypothetical protein
MYHWLDRAPKGRNEDADLWWRRHDEYENKEASKDLRSLDLTRWNRLAKERGARAVVCGTKKRRENLRPA